MIIIWRKFGFLVPLLTIGALAFCELTFDALYGPGYYSGHSWTKGVGTILAGVLNWVVGNRFRQRQPRPLMHRSTVKEFVCDPTPHTFFNFPIHWWGPIWIIVGIVFCMLEFFRSP